MTLRLTKLGLCWLLTALFGLGLLHQPAHAAQVEIVQAHIEPSDDGYRLSSTFSFDLSRGLEEAVLKGLTLYFTTDVELTRRRWYWFDEKAQVTSQTVRIWHDLLTRQFNVQTSQKDSRGGLKQSFATMDEALALVRRPSRWEVAEKSALKSGEVYQLSLRMRLDLGQLSKPFQVHAINNSDWRLASEWRSFNFKAE